MHSTTNLTNIMPSSSKSMVVDFSQGRTQNRTEVLPYYSIKIRGSHSSNGCGELGGEKLGIKRADEKLYCMIFTRPH